MTVVPTPSFAAGASMTDAMWNALLTLSGVVIGALGTLGVALLNRKPTLASIVDQRISVLIQSYEQTIADLRAEVAKLEAKVDDLGDQLDRARGFIVKG